MGTKPTIVLYPSPGIGHLISMVEFGKLLLNHHPNSFSITIIILAAPYNTGSTAPYINHVSKTTPSITFHNLTPTSFSSSTTNTTSPHHETLVFEFLRLNNPSLHQALLTISSTSTISAFIIDFFCYPALDIADQLNIPVYFFYTSNVSSLSLFLHLPKLHNNILSSQDSVVNVPGVPPIPYTQLDKIWLDPEDKAYQEFSHCAKQFLKSRVIIVNSFESLEPRALKALTEKLCIPPIYCVGPLIGWKNPVGAGEVTCLEWLDKQPSKSVVYVCFGSMGLLSEAQLKEIAVGLEKSRQRFLWVVRTPQDTTKRLAVLPDPDLDALLPEGFMERTKDRGLVVKSWAPQVEVLNKGSVGGFVSHCGWNSVLEAVCAGVPIVAWPLYAEQRTNRVILVEELKIALWMKEKEDGFVGAKEVENRVAELMGSDSDRGKTIRERVVELSLEAKLATSEGGSSVRALASLAKMWTDV